MKSSTIYWDAYAILCSGEYNGDCAGLDGTPKYETLNEAIAQWNKRV